MPQAKEIRITFHGREHAQYFQGHGLGPKSRFISCATGVGDSNSAALDDALEQIASAGEFSISDDMVRTEVQAMTGQTLESLESLEDYDRIALHDGCPTDEREHEGCELSYFVSIDMR